jgi:hypothetical protein
MTITEQIPTTTEQIPTTELNAIFETLTQQPATGIIWDSSPLPYTIRVARKNPDYSIFDRNLALIAKERLQHSKRCACAGCDVPAPKWKSVERKLQIWIPYLDVMNDDERFVFYLSRSGYTYPPFSEPQIDSRGYKLGREWAGIICSESLSGDPLFRRLAVLAMDQRSALALRARATAQPPSLLATLAEFNEEAA